MIVNYLTISNFIFYVTWSWLGSAVRQLFTVGGLGFGRLKLSLDNRTIKLCFDQRGQCSVLEASWNMMAHVQKPDFVFRRKGRVHLNRPRGRQFSRLLAAEMCASAVVMLDTPCSEVVWRVLATHSIRQFPLHFPSRASPCAITFQLEF
jgi:hypothetical protein